jgi:uncharacterized DUF497 family protein
MTHNGLVQFEWDDVKNAANQDKHGVSFEEASELFTSGEDYLEIFDAAHSDDEDRVIAIGPINRGLVLIAWTERDEDVVRIISARWANPREKKLYLEYMEQQT